MTAAAAAILQILVWGIVATLAMNAVMFSSQNLGWSRLNMPLLLGTFFTDDRAAANTLGFFLYVILGWLIAFFYYLVFALIGAAGWWRGALVGLGHGLLAYIHPRVASEYDGPTAKKRLEPPGFLALHYGRNTPLVTLAAHLVYGVVLGVGFAF